MTNNLSLSSNEDLQRSGLEASDIKARPITSTELSAIGVGGNNGGMDGYVIPYFDILGKPVPYYRVKFVDSNVPVKYRGPKGASNYIYYPPGFLNVLRKDKHKYVIITEGEKKAACAVKNGIPCVAVGGVDNWRNRQLIFPDASKLESIPGRGMMKAKIPSGDSNDLVFLETGTLATGLSDLIDYLILHNTNIILLYDTDEDGVKMQVQRACAMFAYELRFRGLTISHIRQMVLKAPKKGVKVGLDDYIMIHGAKKFLIGVNNCLKKRNAFPQHPNPKAYIASKLQKRNLSRKESQDIALSAFMELESRGKRLRNKATKSMYYFDQETHTLMDVVLGSTRESLHETTFGSHLYKNFNIGVPDKKIIDWLASQFYGESGTEDTATHKVLAKIEGKPDNIAVQISDSHYVMITPNPEIPFEICENGTNGVLFEQEQVERIDHHVMERALHKAHMDPPDKMLWTKVLEGFNFVMPEAGEGDLSQEHTRQLAALLYYLSPWFLRWRGMQLPIELTIGKPGSGKSSLYELRQMIITGRPLLTNLTTDIKDWYAGITSRGGVYVMDNVHFTGSGKDHRQRISDELCRLTTEPKPHVEMRKLYTTSDVLTMPVHTTFAMTALELPFPNVDLIQRAAIFELLPIESSHNATWVDDQLVHGNGRVGWLAHQLIVMHRFLKAAVWEHQWDPEYRAGNRLAHYEQALMLMARIFKLDDDWIPGALAYKTQSKSSEADLTLNGLIAFSDDMEDEHGDELSKQVFGVAEITKWATEHAEYSRSGQLTNSKRLGKYIRGQLKELERYAGLYEAPSINNRSMYSINPSGD